MNNDKNLEIKKKPQQVTEEDLNKAAGGDPRWESTDCTTGTKSRCH